MIYRDYYIRHIVDVFQEAMAKKRLQDLKNDTSTRIAKMVRNNIIKRGNESSDRYRRFARDVLSFFAQVNYENTKKGSQIMLG